MCVSIYITRLYYFGQVMQEKAAQRLLAQTLHRHMEEEVAKNPRLAADKDAQAELRKLAQQQLLYQMALACRAAAAPGSGKHLSIYRYLSIYIYIDIDIDIDIY